MMPKLLTVEESEWVRDLSINLYYHIANFKFRLAFGSVKKSVILFSSYTCCFLDFYFFDYDISSLIKKICGICVDMSRFS